PELTRLLCVGARVGVGPHRQLALADLVRPAQDGVELLGPLTGLQVECAVDHLASGAVDRDLVALLDGGAVDGERLALDLDLLGADDGGLAPPTSDDGGMADKATSSSENPFGRGHAVDVFGRGLGADEDDLLAPVGGV